MISSSTPPAVAQKPSRTRHLVLLFAATLAVITYIDRICMSQASDYITDEWKIDPSKMSYVFAAFALAYALFEIPGGWLGDKIGPRKVLLRVVVMWSFFTAATGMAWNLAVLAITQFLFGAGEAGAFPNLAKAYTHWLPARERTRAVSTMWVCTRWGGAITPLLVVTLFYLVGWRWAFGLIAVPGVIWAVVFYWWFRDQPRDHTSVNAAELALIEESRPQAATGGHVNVPWSTLLHSRSIWLLILQYFCFGYGWYFYITYLPIYLTQAHGADFKNSVLLSWVPALLHNLPAVNGKPPAVVGKVQGALLAGIPLFFGGFACILSSWLSTWLTRRGVAVISVRRRMAYVGYWGAAAMLLCSALIKDPVWAMLAMGMASFCLDLSLPISWRTAMDVGGKYAGTVSGTMNMAAQLGGVVAPLIVGAILALNHVTTKTAAQTAVDLQNIQHAWMTVFLIYVAFYFVGGLCWFFINPVTPLVARPGFPMPLGRLLFSFGDRIPRQTFWVSTLLLLVFHAFIMAMIFGVFGASGSDAIRTGELIWMILGLATIWPALAIQIKRWHDRGKSGWMVLITLIPVIGGLWSLIELGFLPGHNTENRYGSNPFQLPVLPEPAVRQTS